uniref:Uncharacterized protein n=1 Tax=Stegastes partitus TaxID=144197 RepID=A0A3B5B0V0_9TELE
LQLVLHYNNYNYDLSGQDLTDLYNSPVYQAEWMIRPLESPVMRQLSHTGVRVTLADNSQWLIHKGNNYGISSDTVVSSARHMSSNWRFNGRKTVSDFVKKGGESYNLLFNCHVASIRMILQ